jgi:hypothetical protein
MAKTNPREGCLIVTNLIAEDECHVIERPWGVLILLAPNAAEIFLESVAAAGLTVRAIEGEEHIPKAAVRSSDA